MTSTALPEAGEKKTNPSPGAPATATLAHTTGRQGSNTASTSDTLLEVMEVVVVEVPREVVEETTLLVSSTSRECILST